LIGARRFEECRNGWSADENVVDSVILGSCIGMTACITATGRYLPGAAVSNDEIEDYIGKAGRASSALKDLILATAESRRATTQLTTVKRAPRNSTMSRSTSFNQNGDALVSPAEGW
jgi:hypothetical protein